MRRLLLITFLWTVFACNEDHVDEINIDSVIQVELKLTTTENVQNIVLSCKTKKEFPCYNYLLITDKEVTEELLSITFVGIDKQNYCATAIGPAKRDIDFGELKNGLYTIRLNNGSLRNQGTLEVTDDEVIFNIINPNGIEILTSSVQK
jgi:hypothetical protein